MAMRPKHLSLMSSTAGDVERRFRTLTGREPTPLELQVFARWQVALALGPAVKTRRRAAKDHHSPLTQRRPSFGHTCLSIGKAPV